MHKHVRTCICTYHAREAHVIINYYAVVYKLCVKRVVCVCVCVCVCAYVLNLCEPTIHSFPYLPCSTQSFLHFVLDLSGPRAAGAATSGGGLSLLLLSAGAEAAAAGWRGALGPEPTQEGRRHRR